MQASPSTGAPQGVWVSISDLAKRKGVTRQSLHERVSRLVKDGLIETRQDGKKRLIDMAEYDRVVGQVGDAFREQGAETRRDAETEDTGGSAKLRDVQIERQQYETKIRALDYAERLGRLLPLKGPSGVETAMVKAAEKIVRIIEKTPLRNLAEIEAAARIDAAHLRRVIKAMTHEMRAAVADALQTVATAAADDETETDLTDHPE